MNAEGWLERFEEWMALRGFSPRSRPNYRRRVASFLRFLESRNLGLTGVTGQVLEDYRLVLFYRHYRGRSLAPGSQSNHLTAVKTFFRFLVKDHALLVDPAAGLELPRQRKTLPRVILTEKETRKLIEAPDVSQPVGLRDRAVLELLYSSALRNSELRDLTLDALRLEQKLVWVFRGKGEKSRVVPMGAEAAYWVSEYLVRSRPKLCRSSAEQHVFLCYDGERMKSTLCLQELVRRAARKAGVREDITPHGLRHACATHMLRRGAGLRQLQEILGHASAATTQRYTRVEVSDLRRVHARCHPRERVRKPETVP